MGSLIHMVTDDLPADQDTTSSVHVSLEGRMHLFDGILQINTSRHMTDLSDLFNALLSMLTGFQRRLFPDGFVYGLSLKSHPASLGRMHYRLVEPKHRSMFPSCIWAGWKGTAVIRRDMLHTFDSIVATARPRFRNLKHVLWELRGKNCLLRARR
jgi:hypothetical protein